MKIEYKSKKNEESWPQDPYARKSAISRLVCDRLFENAWFKKNHLDPAWNRYTSAREDLKGFNDNLNSRSEKFNHVGWLKIFFRLGLVALFMLIVHLTSGYLFTQGRHVL